MIFSLKLWGRPTRVVIEVVPVDTPSGNYVKVTILHRGKRLVDGIPDMYPGDNLELTLRF